MTTPEATADQVLAPDLVRWPVGGSPELVDAVTPFLVLLPAGTGVVVQRTDGAIVGANPDAERLLGLTLDQLVGRSSADPRWQAVGEDGLPLPGERHPAMLALQAGESVSGTLMGVLVPDGRNVWIDVDARPLRDCHGTLVGVASFFRDVTMSARGLAAYDRLVSAFRLLAENASDVVFRVTIDAVAEWVSPSIEQLTGRTPAELHGTRLFDLVHPDDRPTVVAARDALIYGEDEQRYRVRFRHVNGTYRWTAAVARPERGADGQFRAAVVALRDIDAEVHSRAALEQLARRDQLTGLANRHELADRLTAMVAGAQRHGRTVAVAVCDLDHFKTVNDTLGHDAGDRVLVEVARRIQSSLREGDVAARLGGDEIVIAWENGPLVRDAVAVAERILATVTAPIEIDGRPVVTTVSIGVALVDADPETAIRQADAAAYVAKSEGRGCVRAAAVSA